LNHRGSNSGESWSASFTEAQQNAFVEISLVGMIVCLGVWFLLPALLGAIVRRRKRKFKIILPVGRSWHS
jgi:glucan phosphoethanolaminetransferase (alkaline phosphatase superfamily)